MSFLASWSGGKDSCFALYKAMGKGYVISHLVNFISKDSQRVSFHGTEAKLIQLQSQALVIPLVQKETTWEGYEQEFRETVQSLISNGIEGMIFGDIYLQEHRDWIERVCSDMNIKAILPLWGKSADNILSEFINEGFEAVIVSAKSDLIDKDWVGRRVDTSFMEYLKKKNIDICGENGEYHTLVTNGPIFNGRIRLFESQVISRDNYWFLCTVRYELS